MEDALNLPRRIAKSESGVTAIEYGLIAALLAVVIIAALIAVGLNLNTTFETVAAATSDANGGGDGTSGGGGDPPGGDTAGGPPGGDSTGDPPDGDSTGDPPGDIVVLLPPGGDTTGGPPGGDTTGGSPGGTGTGGGTGGTDTAGGTGGPGQTTISAQRFTTAGGLDSGSGSLAGGAGSPSATGWSAAPGSDVSGAPDTVVGLTVPMMGGGADESWALAPEKAAAAGSAGEGRKAGNNSGGLSDVSSETINWLGLLVLLVALILIGVNFRRAMQGAERKRQVREWRDSQADNKNPQV